MLVELMCRYLCHLKELLVTDDRIIIEEQEYEHLIRGTQELVSLSFLESATDFCIAQG